MRYASFYAGAGGLDLGARQAGLVPRFVTDIDYDCVTTARQGLDFPDLCEFTVADMNELLWSGVLRGKRGEIDVVIGGPPCQGFSKAGRMDPEDLRSEQVFLFMNAVSQIRPAAFLMENVAALASKRWSLVLERLERMASIMGYDTHVRVLNAVHYGVGQNRERMFLFGLPKGCELAMPDLAGPYVRSARDVLDSLPRSAPDIIPSARITLARNPVLRRSPYAGMLVNGGGRIIDLDAPCPTLPATMGGNRTPIIDLDQLNLGTEPWIAGYHADLMDGEPPLARIPGFVSMRRLSMNECAALQGFPPSYPFAGKPSSRWRQIGNAVPPRLGEVAVRALIGNLT